MITTDITMDKIDKFWNLLEKSLAEKMSAVNAEAERFMISYDFFSIVTIIYLKTFQ